MHIRTLIEKRRAAPARTIDGGLSLADAAAVMCAEGISTMIVTRDGAPVGALSRGDVLVNLMKDPGKAATDLPVSEAMSPKLVAISPEDRVDGALERMMAGGIRSIPVIEDERILGVLPMEVLFECRIEALQAEMRHLQDYITDLQEAGID
jgi:CBS domain-containing protein